MITEVHEWMAQMVARYAPQAPVLEVGSYNVNGTVRDLLPQPYVGVDMREGPGVDVVLDLAENVLEPIFHTLVCLETLEHCAEPLAVLRNLRESALPGARFFGSWPFMFEVHDYPDDYWRVTPSGFRYLLEQAGYVDVDVERRWPTHCVATARVPE